MVERWFISFWGPFYFFQELCNVSFREGVHRLIQETHIFPGSHVSLLVSKLEMRKLSRIKKHVFFFITPYATYIVGMYLLGPNPLLNGSNRGA